MSLARRTHCKRGHELSGANVYPRANGWRQCMVCLKDSRDRWNEARAMRAIARKARSRPRRVTLQVFDKPRVGVPHPVRGRSLVNIYDIEHAQRLGCARRDECVDYAARTGWRSFSCRECKAFVQLLPSLPPTRSDNWAWPTATHMQKVAGARGCLTIDF